MTNMRIAGVALLLFSSVLLGVGIHHLVATGTCSSTGYSANYGPVPTCPSGTGWYMAFVFGGVIGAIAGGLMATSLALLFAGIFGAIGVGALTIALDSTARNGAKVFGAIFGACFAIVGVLAGIAVIASALSALRGSRGAKPARKTSGTPTPAPAGAYSDAAAAFGGSAKGAPQPQPSPAAAATVRTTTTHAPTPADLIPGLQAAATRSGSADPVQELQRLAELHQKGALTDAEFASAKAKLLERM